MAKVPGSGGVLFKASAPRGGRCLAQVREAGATLAGEVVEEE